MIALATKGHDEITCSSHARVENAWPGAHVAKVTGRGCANLGKHDLLNFHMAKAEDAGERRARELTRLAAEGVPVCFEYRWKARVGTLYIWPYSGRWLNQKNGSRGRIDGLTMRQLIDRRG